MRRDVVGRALPRTDGRDKVTGRARFAIDTVLPDMLHVVVVRSLSPHARIVDVVTKAAERASGVVRVITAADLEGLFPRFGHIVADRPVLAIDRVRYDGEPVALVVARTRAEAEDAAGLVEVVYEDLPALLDPSEALSPGAPLLHPERYERGDEAFGEAHSDSGLPASNLAHQVVSGWGDVEAALHAADEVVETRTYFPMLYAYAMEPYNATARWSGGALEVRTGAQHPFMVREDLARIFGLPRSRVRVVSEYIGGGYGSKSYTKVEPMAAVASWLTGQPVKLVLDVEGSIHTTRADPARVRVRTGFTRDGHILGRDVEIEMDGGAYADNGPLVVAKAAARCAGPYRVPALRARARSVYTNTVPSSSYRGFGAPQVTLAGEVNMDQAAERLGLPPAEIRRINLAKPGEQLVPGKRPMDADLHADLEMVVRALEARDHDGAGPHGAGLHGAGIACSASDAGAYPVSTAWVRILADGSAVVSTGATEMGQGSRTALAQIAAEELGMEPGDVHVVQGDTDSVPYERTTGASRTTTLAGTAIVRACADAGDKLRRMLAEAVGCEPESVTVEPGRVVAPDRQVYAFGDVVRRWFGVQGGEVVGVGIVRKEGQFAMLPPFWEIGMVGVSLDVDPDTGVASVDHLVTVGDVGFAINPAMVEGQDLGAATQGLGAALYEELIYDGPQLANANVVDYRVPRMADTPRRVDTLVAQRGDGIGPYGAKGAGEGALNPIGAAVAAAVARAVGRWPDQLPLTPERIWRLTRQSGDG